MKMRIGLVLVQVVLLAIVDLHRAAGGPCEEVEIVTRAEWNARPPKSIEYIGKPVNMSFVHHTAGTWQCFDKETCIRMVQDIQNLHMDTNGWDDIGYSYLIGEDGRVYEGRTWNVVGAHTYRYNSVSYGFCIIGNFMTRPPNEASLNTTQNIIECGVQLGHILPNYELFGHRDGRCTECPGDYLYAIIRDWTHYSFRHIPIYCSSPVSSSPSSAVKMQRNDCTANSLSSPFWVLFPLLCLFQVYYLQSHYFCPV